MTNSLTLDISKQLKSSDLQVSSAWLIGAEPLHKGDTAHIKVNILLAEGIKAFSARLLIYDTDWECAFASPFESVESASSGQYCINFYFLIGLKPGIYLATFEFLKTLKNCDDLHNLLGRYNSFIELTIDGVPPENTSGYAANQGYTQQLNSTSIFPVKAEYSLLKNNGERLAMEQMPWPELEEQVLLTDLAATLRAICTDINLVPSEHTADASPLTPSSYDRKFFAAHSPMNSKIGVPEGSGVRSNGSAGYLLFGPYLSVLSGQYEVTFECKTGAVSNGHSATFDVVARKGTLSLVNAAPVLPNNEHLSVRLEFKVESPGLVDLELRINVTKGTDFLAESVAIRSLVSESTKATKKIERIVAAAVANTNVANSLLQRYDKNPKNIEYAQLVVIFIPHQAFTICGLIVAHHLFKKSNNKIILVSGGNFNDNINASILRLCGIQKCVLLKDIKDELSSSKIDALITHSENSLWHTTILLNELSKTNQEIELRAYSDGFRNAANSKELAAFHPITKLYFFGMPDLSMRPINGITNEIISFKTSQRVLTRYAQAHKFFAHEPFGRYEKYSVFCLRYWGLDGYNFPPKLVAKIWYETISSHTPKDELIIIKGGGGHSTNNEVYTEFKKLITENGYIFIDAENYLTSCGMPTGSSESALEYLLYFGLFQRATRFYSLDSSVPIILAQLDYLARPVEFVCGANNLQRFNLYSGFQVIKRNLSQLRNTFAHTSFFEPFEVIEEDPNCFTIKLG